MNRPLWRRIAAILSLGLVAFALAACGSDDGGDSSDPTSTGASGSGEVGWDSAGLQASLQGAPFQPRIINSPNGLGVGTNRIAVALQTADGQLVSDAQVTARVFRLAEDPNDEPQTGEQVAEITLITRTLDVHEDHQHADPGVASLAPTIEGDAATHPIANAPAPRAVEAARLHEDALTTVYTAEVEFDAQGWWGISLDVTSGGQTYEDLRVTRFVLNDPPMPIVGDEAIPAVQLILDDVDGDASQISTAAEPVEDMLDQTIADAVQNGRPTVIAFVTPAFCQTRFCGPVLELVVAPVWQDYGDQVDFVHVEPYVIEAARNQGVLQPVQAVFDWGLETEPFIYVIDAEGVITAAIEGITDEAELRAEVEAVLP